MISYYRIDERVIHGQTLNVVTRKFPCDGIIVVDDEIANDEFWITVFKGMTNYRVLIFNEEAAMRKLPEAEKSSRNYFVIFKHPTTLANLIRKGYQVKQPEIMVGPQIARPGTTTFFPTMCLTDEEIEAMDLIASKGTIIMMQSILNQIPITWQEAKKRINL
ncbi:MAG: PTS sugar transporter subunit IIB [Erysipelotrichaceae bacterium]|jgi:PTS system mannose-specific IIB component